MKNKKQINIRSVTAWLKILKAGQWDYFGTRHFRDNKFRAETINPAPEFIYERRLWMHMGTFTDYMIRKFFRDKLVSPEAEIIVEDYLISEIAMGLHKNNGITAHLLPTSGKEGFTEEDDRKSDELYKMGPEWINNYKNGNWKEVIQDSWLMSGLDSLSRSLYFPETKTLEGHEIKETTVFLENILEWLQKTFNSAKKVYLNPILGVSNFVMADADLIIDNTLLDIKTTKHPRKAPNYDVNQLLIYVGLCHFHTTEKVRESRIFPEINKIAFLLSQQLTLWERDLDDFTISDRENMISKLKDLAEGKVKEL